MMSLELAVATTIEELIIHAGKAWGGTKAVNGGRLRAAPCLDDVQAAQKSRDVARMSPQNNQLRTTCRGRGLLSMVPDQNIHKIGRLKIRSK